MKKTILLLTALASLIMANQGFAYDVYRITIRNTLVTRYHTDLVTLIQLNAHSVQSKVRAFYNQLKAQHASLALQPGDVVIVSSYYNDGTAQIDFSDQHGYIAKEDLTHQLQAN